MCGIGGIISLSNTKINQLESKLNNINSVQRHRGPDSYGIYINKNETVGLAHTRLSILDLSTKNSQPMTCNSNTIILNGEIYNYIELRQQYPYKYKTTGDTEVVLHLYEYDSVNFIEHLDGMFSFVIYNEKDNSVICARDRFGIKPFYYTIQNNIFYFASEIKALLPFLIKKDIDYNSLKDYLTFQFILDNKTLFKDVYELPPAHKLVISNGNVTIARYWNYKYTIDCVHTKEYFTEKLRYLFSRSIERHLRADVDMGSYISGGIDSAIVSVLANHYKSIVGFHGRFLNGDKYDESTYANEIAKKYEIKLNILDITREDFLTHISNVIYYLDQPTAGPGSFSQYMVSKYVSDNYFKVILGGQGGDEIFGGYVRYLIAYFEQCILGAIDGTLNNGNYVVTYESILKNLTSLQTYKPMLKTFLSKGLYDPADQRYFQLINRAPDIRNLINWELFDDKYDSYEIFRDIYYTNNIDNISYFDRMTHFDFKTSLCALLHVEDRMSMANGIEARVPFLDRELFEFSITIPPDIKFEAGDLKHVLKYSFKDILPEKIINRKNKMGFPVPLDIWMKDKKFKENIYDIISISQPYIINANNYIDNNNEYSRNLWALLSLSLWYKQYFK